MSIATLATLWLGAGPASAHEVPATCTAQNGVPPGRAEMSPNVEHLGWYPTEIDVTPGGHRIGDRFYITGVSHFSVYDISEPAKPKLVSRLDFPCRFENEDVATDGRSLVYSDFATNGSLFIYDVRDATKPALVAEVPGAGTHTMTCVLDCRYLFGSYQVATAAGPNATGKVVDLREPSAPKVLGDWTADGVLPSRKVHDLTEIAPGLVLSASAPIQLMDVRTNQVKPSVLVRSPESDTRRWHSVEWPRQGLDRFVLAIFETNGTSRCEAGVGDFAVFDASRAAQTGLLEPRSSFFLSNSNNELTSGNPAVNAGLGCSPHWFETRPSWKDGGVVAMGAYDHGAKFLRVQPSGAIWEVGHFRAPGTNASATYWITCDIVYVVDYTRGLDVLRFRDAESDCKPGDPPPQGAAPAGSSSGGPMTNAPAQAPERLAAKVSPRWRVGRRSTQLRRLTVTALPVAAAVRVRCRGGCPFGSRVLVVRRGRATTTRLRRARLRPGAIVEVLISRPGAVTQRVAFRVRARRAPQRISPASRAGGKR